MRNPICSNYYSISYLCDSMNFLRRHAPVIILQLCTYGILFIALGGFIFEANSRLFNPGGDGIKNYFTFAYQLKHGKGWWFDGMTYPYGEHLLFTDSFAAYAWLLNFIDDHLVTLHPYSVGIINLTVLLTFGLCSWFLYKILRYYGLANWYAVPAALCICFLSPQVIRLEFHYSLAFAFYVPMLWYFILKILKKTEQPTKKSLPFNGGKDKTLLRKSGGFKPTAFAKQGRSRFFSSSLFWTLIIIIAICFFGLIHPYYLPLGSFFVLAFATIYTLQNIRRLGAYARPLLFLFVAALLPIVLLGIFTAVTDPVADRHIAPYGLWVYVSKFEAIFFSNIKPVRTWWDFAKLPSTDMEGVSYVGFWGLLILILTGFRLIWRLWKKRFNKALHLTADPTLNSFLWASVLLLILSFALPFLWFGFLLDWVPKLRQFRSLGRFAWAFYYVYSVYMAYYFYLMIKWLFQKANRKGVASKLHNNQSEVQQFPLQKGTKERQYPPLEASIERSRNGAQGEDKRAGRTIFKKVGIALAILVLGFWGFEAGINIHTTAQTMYKHKNENYVFKDNNDYGKYMKEAGYKSDDFQAILPLPYFNNGSEKWYIYRDGRAAAQAYKCAFETGLPISALHSPRTSISQAAKMAQLLSSDLIEKKILPDLTEQPFLLLVYNHGNLKPDEQQLVKKAKQIYKNKEISLYELPLTAFETRFESIRNTFQTKKDSLVKGDNFLSTSEPKVVILNTFDEQPSDLTFAGTGAANSGDSPKLTLYDGVLPNVGQQVWMEATVWLAGDDYRAGFPKFFHYQYNDKGEQVGLNVVNSKHDTEIYNEGEWVLARIIFKYKNAGNRVHIYLESEDQKTLGIIADEFLLRPADTDVFYSENEAEFLYNSYKIPKQEQH